jgi:hypothetical protein
LKFEIFKFRVSEMPFPGLWGRFDRILMVRKQLLVCRYLQFGGTKWAKAYLINYILDKLQESMCNIFILCSLLWIMYSRLKLIKLKIDKCLHDFEKKRLLANYRLLRPCHI